MCDYDISISAERTVATVGEFVTDHAHLFLTTGEFTIPVNFPFPVGCFGIFHDLFILL